MVSPETLFRGTRRRSDRNVVDQAAAQRVKGLVERLTSQMSDVSLDDIDGAFYWECCRPDFVAEINARRRQYRSNSELVAAVHEVSERFHILPLSVHNRINDPSHIIPLHGPVARVYPTDEVPHVSCAIHSGDTTGDLFAEWLDSYLDNARLAGILAPRLDDEFSGSVHSIMMEIQELSVDENSGPHVRGLSVLIGLPLPHRDLISTVFDTALRLTPAWRMLLTHDHGSKDRNANRTAIRTWGVALLQRSGMSNYRARATISDLMGLPSTVLKNTDLAARDDLEARLPGMHSFLYTR